MDGYAMKGSDMRKVSTISLFAITCILVGPAQAQSLDRPQIKAFGYTFDAPNAGARVAPEFQASAAASAADSSPATAEHRTVGGVRQVKAFGYWIDAPHYQ
jgi:uncharacterized membrane protein YcgQ (UPF0703/DUF1980 family)